VISHSQNHRSPSKNTEQQRAKQTMEENVATIFQTSRNYLLTYTQKKTTKGNQERAKIQENDQQAEHTHEIERRQNKKPKSTYKQKKEGYIKTI